MWFSLWKWASSLRWERKKANVASVHHVLVVDDCWTDSEMLARLIKKLGHTCDIAHTAEDGVTLFRAKSYDMAFVDLGLPQMPGWELLELIGKESDLIPVVITGADSITGIPHGVRFLLVRKEITLKALSDCLACINRNTQPKP